jgi:hypothetical protein
VAFVAQGFELTGVKLLDVTLMALEVMHIRGWNIDALAYPILTPRMLGQVRLADLAPASIIQPLASWVPLHIQIPQVSRAPAAIRDQRGAPRM